MLVAPGAFAQSDAAQGCDPGFGDRVAEVLVLRDGRDPSQVEGEPSSELRFDIALIVNDFLARLPEMQNDRELPSGLRGISSRRVRTLRDEGRAVPPVCEIVGFMHTYYRRPPDDRLRPIQIASSAPAAPPRPSERASAPAPPPPRPAPAKQQPTQLTRGQLLRAELPSAESEEALPRDAAPVVGSPSERPEPERAPSAAVEAADDRAAERPSQPLRRDVPQPEPVEVRRDDRLDLPSVASRSGFEPVPDPGRPSVEDPLQLAAGESPVEPAPGLPSEQTARMVQRIERLLAVPPYLTLRDLRWENIRMTQAELSKQRRDAMAARKDLLDTFDAMARDRSVWRAVREALGPDGVERVTEGIERTFADSRVDDERRRALQIWRTGSR